MAGVGGMAQQGGGLKVKKMVLIELLQTIEASPEVPVARLPAHICKVS